MKKETILNLAKMNNGYIHSQIIKENNIPHIYLTRLVNEKQLIRVSRGIYVLPDIIEDPFYLKSLSYSKLVYSGKTALYLNNLSNRQFEDFEASFPYGTNIPKIEEFTLKQSRKSTFYLGVEMIETPYGNKVKCYNKERCICELFIHDDFDPEDRVFAINEYRHNYLDYDRLYDYAEKLNILEKVKNVFEVLGWN